MLPKALFLSFGALWIPAAVGWTCVQPDSALARWRLLIVVVFLTPFVLVKGMGGVWFLAFPFVVSTSAAGPTASLKLGERSLRVAPAELAAANLLVDGGIWGGLTTYTAAGVAGFDADQAGVYASPRITLPPNPAWLGTALWVQALIVDAAMQPVDVTNVVRLSLE